MLAIPNTSSDVPSSTASAASVACFVAPTAPVATLMEATAAASAASAACQVLGNLSALEISSVRFTTNPEEIYSPFFLISTAARDPHISLSTQVGSAK